MNMTSCVIALSACSVMLSSVHVTARQPGKFPTVPAGELNYRYATERPLPVRGQMREFVRKYRLRALVVLDSEAYFAPSRPGAAKNRIYGGEHVNIRVAARTLSGAAKQLAQSWKGYRTRVKRYDSRKWLIVYPAEVGHMLFAQETFPKEAVPSESVYREGSISLVRCESASGDSRAASIWENGEELAKKGRRDVRHYIEASIMRSGYRSAVLPQRSEEDPVRKYFGRKVAGVHREDFHGELADFEELQSEKGSLASRVLSILGKDDSVYMFFYPNPPGCLGYGVMLQANGEGRSLLAAIGRRHDMSGLSNEELIDKIRGESGDQGLIRSNRDIILEIRKRGAGPVAIMLRGRSLSAEKQSVLEFLMETPRFKYSKLALEMADYAISNKDYYQGLNILLANIHRDGVEERIDKIVYDPGLPERVAASMYTTISYAHNEVSEEARGKWLEHLEPSRERSLRLSALSLIGGKGVSGREVDRESLSKKERRLVEQYIKDVMEGGPVGPMDRHDVREKRTKKYRWYRKVFGESFAK